MSDENNEVLERSGLGRATISMRALTEFARRAKPREQIIYYVGVVLSQGSAIGAAAMRLYDGGMIELTQRRIERSEHPEGLGKFEYIATRTERPFFA